MRVGIVGSGVAGLAAARTLVASGAEVVVFEQDDWVGGRCHTVTMDGYVFDPGASSIVPRGRAVEAVILRELDPSGLVQIKLPVYTHDGRRVFRGEGLAPTHRYCYQQGIQRLGELLASGLDVRKRSKVTRLHGLKIGAEVFDHIVLAVPTPVAEHLLEPVEPGRKAFNTRYRSCLSVLLAFERETRVDFHAVVAEESAHPMHWLSIENLKTPGRAPDGCTALVVQMGPKYSKWNFEARDQEVIDDALVDVERVLGEGYSSPVRKEVVRWLYSQPDSVSGFESVNPRGSRIVIASDGLEGGRIEHAYEAGLKAAEAVLDR